MAALLLSGAAFAQPSLTDPLIRKAAAFSGAPGAQLRRPGPAGHGEPLLAQTYETHQLLERAARIAEARATEPEVRAWARRLRRDHAFAASKALSTSRKLGMNLSGAVEYLRQRVAQPEAADDGAYGPQTRAVRELRAELRALRKLEGRAFDARFVELMLAAHQSEVRRLTDGLAEIPLPALSKLLGRQLRVLEQHVALGDVVLEDLRGPEWPRP